MTLKAYLKIEDLRIWLTLGCSEEERFNPQAVSVDIEIYFKSGRSVFAQDDISKVFCYKSCVEKIQESLKDSSFNLIEAVALRIHEVVKDLSKQSDLGDCEIEITTKKLSPPVPGIHGPVSFVYRE